jgi:outer membrane protein assembly factor BamD (BamD/ComL family)
MKNLIVPLITLFSFFITSCGNKKNSPHKAENEIPLKEQIKTAESTLSPTNPSKAQLLDLISLYKQYVDSFPKDKLSPTYLIKAGDFYGTINLPNEKGNMYKKAIELYPGFKDADMVQYLYASTLDSDLNKRVEAKKQYELLLEKFPRSIYAADAKERLMTIDSLSFKQLEDKIIREQMQPSK